MKKAALFILTIFIAQNVFFAHAAEANFWADRRKTVQPSESAPHDVFTQFAQLPALQPGLIQPLSPKALGDLKLGGTSAVQAVPAWMQNAIAPYATIQGIEVSNKPHAKTVLLLQDAHLHKEAQTNMAGAIEALAQHEKLLVGLEAAPYKLIDLSVFYDFPYPKELRETGMDFMKMNILNGAEVAAVSAPRSYIYAGVENWREYQANVNAFRHSLPVKEKSEKETEELRQELAQLKRAHYTPDLMQFDHKKAGFEDDSIGISDYVLTLDGLVPATTPALKELIAAALIEGSLDFEKVERERTAMLDVLLKKMSEKETGELLQVSQMFRSGHVGYAAYYDYLKKLCGKNGVALSKYPEMGLYIQYVLKSEAIDQNLLFTELKAHEKTAIATLAATPKQKEIVAASNYYHLVKKLIKHEMTEEEWKEYQEVRSAKSEVRRGDSPDYALRTSGLNAFEQFYELALARNHSMARHMAHLLKKSPADYGVLVAGGFHTNGLVENLKKEGFTVLTVAPKITQLEEGGLSSLDILASSQRPIDQLFKGERLFLDQARAFGTALPRIADSLKVRAGEKAGVKISPAKPLGTGTKALIKTLATSIALIAIYGFGAAHAQGADGVATLAQITSTGFWAFLIIGAILAIFWWAGRPKPPSSNGGGSSSFGGGGSYFGSILMVVAALGILFTGVAADGVPQFGPYIGSIALFSIALFLLLGYKLKSPKQGVLALWGAIFAALIYIFGVHLSTPMPQKQNEVPPVQQEENKELKQDDDSPDEFKDKPISEPFRTRDGGIGVRLLVLLAAAPLFAISMGAEFISASGLSWTNPAWLVILGVGLVAAATVVMLSKSKETTFRERMQVVGDELYKLEEAIHKKSFDEKFSGVFAAQIETQDFLRLLTDDKPEFDPNDEIMVERLQHLMARLELLSFAAKRHIDENATEFPMLHAMLPLSRPVKTAVGDSFGRDSASFDHTQPKREGQNWSKPMNTFGLLALAGVLLSPVIAAAAVATTVAKPEVQPGQQGLVDALKNIFTVPNDIGTIVSWVIVLGVAGVIAWSIYKAKRSDKNTPGKYQPRGSDGRWKNKRMLLVGLPVFLATQMGAEAAATASSWSFTISGPIFFLGLMLFLNVIFFLTHRSKSNGLVEAVMAQREAEIRIQERKEASAFVTGAAVVGVMSGLGVLMVFAPQQFADLLNWVFNLFRNPLTVTAGVALGSVLVRPTGDPVRDYLAGGVDVTTQLNLLKGEVLDLLRTVEDRDINERLTFVNSALSHMQRVARVNEPLTSISGNLKEALENLLTAAKDNPQFAERMHSKQYPHLQNLLDDLNNYTGPRIDWDALTKRMTTPVKVLVVIGLAGYLLWSIAGPAVSVAATGTQLAYLGFLAWPERGGRREVERQAAVSSALRVLYEGPLPKILDARFKRHGLHLNGIKINLGKRFTGSQIKAIANAAQASTVAGPLEVINGLNQAVTDGYEFSAVGTTELRTTLKLNEQGHITIGYLDDGEDLSREVDAIKEARRSAKDGEVINLPRMRSKVAYDKLLDNAQSRGDANVSFIRAALIDKQLNWIFLDDSLEQALQEAIAVRNESESVNASKAILYLLAQIGSPVNAVSVVSSSVVQFNIGINESERLAFANALRARGFSAGLIHAMVFIIMTPIANMDVEGGVEGYLIGTKHA